MQWIKRGRILEPGTRYDWLRTAAGSAFALTDGGVQTDGVPVYVAGRDEQGRSHIGLVHLDPERARITAIEESPVLRLGEPGTFDQNGTSYPWLVRGADGRLLLYYTGWVPAVLVPWQNDLGLATSADDRYFERVSRAPILPRTNAEPLGIGSVCVLREGDRWRMWYTCFDRWDLSSRERHWYHIRSAESKNGMDWTDRGRIALSYTAQDEHVFGKPCVLRWGSRYVMWYSYRGSSYRIGMADSDDGDLWRRCDGAVGIGASATGWDSEMVCYSHVFSWQGRWFMLYNGNGYGRGGLGLAELVDDAIP
jgi:hypothetical protein